MTDNPLTHPGAAHPDLREPMIGLLVRTFYERARQDDVIGPVFAAAVEDWEDHIAKITDFWSSVMLRTGRYGGRPMRPHLILPLEGRHFDRWLDLFEATARELCRRRSRRPSSSGRGDRRQLRMAGAAARRICCAPA